MPVMIKDITYIHIYIERYTHIYREKERLAMEKKKIVSQIGNVSQRSLQF